MEIKICVNTYRMFFMEGGVDVMAQRRRGVTKDVSETVATKKHLKWLKWLKEETTVYADEPACREWFIHDGKSQIVKRERKPWCEYTKYATS